MTDEGRSGRLGALRFGAVPYVPATRQAAGSLAGWATSLARRPTAVSNELLAWALDELRVMAGASPVAVEPGDQRFADPAWDRAAWSRLAEFYLAARAGLLHSVDAADLERGEADRVRFFLGLFADAMAPTNFLVSNPAALKRAVRTQGRSLLAGGRQFSRDMLHNGAMPTQVDSRPFRVGETIAATPGAIVHRSELFELIQYAPQTSRVATIPLVVVPPQINRYYFLDMAPDRSFVEYCVRRGISTFIISWRNPRPEHRAWNLESYAAASLEAAHIAADISRSTQTNLMGFCSGGMTAMALVSHLNQREDASIHAVGTAVSLVDSSVPGALTAFMSAASQAASLATSRRKGVLDARSLSRLFAWVRANDLVWSYWVSNYLLGTTPAAFDILAWNADGTNMSAGLHADFVKIWSANALMMRGSVDVLGSPLDLAAIKNDMYMVGAVTDHLVPWQSAYAATQLVQGSTRFVLSRSGHIQALVNPPGNAKSSFAHNPNNGADPQRWLDGAAVVKGSWWVDWADWLSQRSGPSRSARSTLGSRAHAVIEPAPGRYVHER